MLLTPDDIALGLSLGTFSIIINLSHQAPTSIFGNFTVIDIIVRQRQAATTKQRAYRLYLAQKKLKKLRLAADKKMEAACIIQSRDRGYLTRIHYQNMRQNFM
ncbi:unnamed protein product [Cercopithifilaria johnstoni]|uniref:Uncharacterized protein n=1 Tax=Cercopithifilaria johnstoni TaxID=2874296 RepID=A0A8J2MTX2_9BILA|nr:unnamed protein product [Cercopithifilaria johnstoni]